MANPSRSPAAVGETGAVSRVVSPKRRSGRCVICGASLDAATREGARARLPACGEANRLRRLYTEGYRQAPPHGWNHRGHGPRESSP